MAYPGGVGMVEAPYAELGACPAVGVDGVAALALLLPYAPP